MPLLHDAARTVLDAVFPRQMYERRIFRTGEIEIEETFLPLLVDPNRESIDVGANKGRYTVALARLTRHVHAFEPYPSLADALRRVARSNVSVHNEALSDKIGEAQLFVEFGSRGAPIVDLATLVRRTVHDEKPTEVRTVRTSTLDRFADNDVGFVKIDVEGHEVNVLSGGMQLLTRQKPTLLIEIEERHRHGSFDDVLGLLGPLGYRGFYVCDGKTHDISDFTTALQRIEELRKQGPRRDKTYVNNFIFVPGDRDITALRAEIDSRLSVH